jgi:hypothetical protein
VVAHEWGHAYTQYTHDLIYQWQSGALNESYSDIWGETVDMLNGVGTDSPAPVRTVNACTTHTGPVPQLTVNSPASIAGSYAAGAAQFGPALTAPGLTGNVVLGDDGTGSTSDACEPLVPASPSPGSTPRGRPSGPPPATSAASPWARVRSAATKRAMGCAW